MKSSLLLFTFLFVVSFFASGQSDPYAGQWSRVYKFELKALPKSALAVVDTIYARAKREKNMPQLTKALIYQSKFAVTLQDGAELRIVEKFEKEIRESQPPLRNLLESVLANICWQYFEEHREAYYERSETEEEVIADDFRTKDADAMLRKIRRHYQNSLHDAPRLQQVSLTGLNAILIQAENSRRYRPTLYDLLAHDALDFYKTGESDFTVPATPFELNTQPYFETFENPAIAQADSTSPAGLLAMKIFRDLLSFHKQAHDTAAFVDLEIERLQFLVNASRSKKIDVTELHKKALTKLADNYRRHPASALADFALASVLYLEGRSTRDLTTQNRLKVKEALDLCNKVITTFPGSDGAEKCSLLKETILTQRLDLKGERYVPISTASRIFIDYTNIDSLSLSVFRVSDEFGKRFKQSKSDSLQFAELAQLTPEVRWQVVLKNPGDYLPHNTEVIVPELTQGRYILLARVTDARNRTSKGLFAHAVMQVTNITLLETMLSGNNYRFQVVDRNTGKPLEGAEVQLKTTATHNGALQYERHFVSGLHGFLAFQNEAQYTPSVEATVSYQGDHAVFGGYAFHALHEPKEKQGDEHLAASTFLFSDRSLYRPGQTVQFKGILIQTRDKKSAVVPGQYVQVFMEDVNGQQTGSLRLKTNTFGSFSGEFKLPGTGLTGEYRVYADEDSTDENEFYANLDDFEGNALNISVEEYKRPTFEASFKPVKETFRLNDTITVQGMATAFSGSKVSGARIGYRVKRTVQYTIQYPHEYNRSYWDNYSREQEITSGEGVTDQDGAFAISFKAVPDEAASSEKRPVFYYEVTVDVTDISGETRSAITIVKAGYHSLLARVHTADLVDTKMPEHIITVRTENLNGQPVAAKGTLEIYKLTPPAVPQRPRLWKAPDLPLISEEEFRKRFPHDPYNNENGPETWKKGKLMTEAAFNTAMSGEVKFTINKSWESGSYVIELKTTDEWNNAVTALHRFTLSDPDSKLVADNQLIVFELDKPAYKAGEQAKLKIGSASADITFTIDIEKDHKIVKTYVEHLSGNTKTLTIPVTESEYNGFAIHYSTAGYNAFLYENKVIPIITDAPQIKIETITFKDKLQPGARETWSFEVKGSGTGKKEAEILASMYDASLDQFKPHGWIFQPIEQKTYYSNTTTFAYQNFGDQTFAVKNQHHGFYPALRQYFDELDWFGFNLSDNPYVSKQYLGRFYDAGADADNPPKVTMIHNKSLQKGSIHGTVIARGHGTPMAGVTITIKGTTQSTVTDAQGNYTIEAGKGDVLVYSFTGFSTAEAKVSRKNTIHVLMAESLTALSGSVTTAQGAPVTKALTYYSYSSGRSADFDDLNPIVRSPRYRVGYGETGNVLIRGNTSLPTAAANGPLYIVDGVIAEASSITDQDIASLEVLKGQDAIALYGARAINGVVMVTTKQGQQKPDEALAAVSVRKNFNETAFFFPHLTTGDNGSIRFSFTTPEALTRWKLQLLAHNRQLTTATKTLYTVTQKELMVTPNAPRFLRAGDDIVFSAKITNLSGGNIDGNVALQLSDAVTGKTADNVFNNTIRSQAFKVSAGASTAVSWNLKVPAGIDAVQYKVVAKAGSFSDGEQNALPILSDRTLVTESLPMQVRSGETKTFSLEKLKTTSSPTLQHHQLTLEVTSNPAWYAIQALPYLMEYPHECAEQTFSRFYANTLASHIAGSNPRIREVFNQWAASPALLSNLEKNQELKSIIIHETPWLRDAQNESEQKKRIALLFDLHKMEDQAQAAVDKLREMQLDNGGFPWFGGAKQASRYITQHIASGLGHLKKLNVPLAGDKATEIISRAVAFLDEEIWADYNALLTQADLVRKNAGTGQDGTLQAKAFLEKRNTHNEHIHYLYMRSFFADIPLSKKAAPAVAYYANQSAQHWKDYNLYLKAMIALVHHRAQQPALSKDILRSLKETSITSDEMGMYWKENKAGWYWNEAPVETQALLIEAFAEIEAADSAVPESEKEKTIDALRTWLLKNKQTSQWSSTKATTEAIYALVLNGTPWLTLQNQVEISVGNKKTGPGIQQGLQPEAGTGYFKTTWKAEAITPAMSEVTLTKKETGMAWAALHWQYFEDLDKITTAETPLRLTKKVFVVTRTDKGEQLKEVSNSIALKTGDLLRIRITLSADRPMEFLHMKDMRAAGLEPVDVLSGYKWQEKLGYYQSTKDASTSFFFDTIPQGIYVFEYDLRVSSQGNFSNGITTIQSMYAPEFNSHSKGVRIVVEE